MDTCSSAGPIASYSESTVRAAAFRNAVFTFDHIFSIRLCSGEYAGNHCTLAPRDSLA